MNINKIATITAALSASLLLNAPSLLAQDTSGSAAPAAAPAPATSGSTAAGGGGGGGGGNGQNFRQRMIDRIKTDLKATDDEWAVIQPLLQKVQDLQRAGMAARFAAFGGGGRRGGGQGGGPGGADPNAPTPTPSATNAASTALSTALQSDATSDDDIKAKLAALRAARKDAATALEAARADLTKVLTPRQEAVLVNMGILE